MPSQGSPSRRRVCPTAAAAIRLRSENRDPDEKYLMKKDIAARYGDIDDDLIRSQVQENYVLQSGRTVHVIDESGAPLITRHKLDKDRSDEQTIKGHCGIP